MQENFTKFITNQLPSYPADYCEDEDYLNEIDFLNNNFRTFGSGLSELMRKCGYDGSDDPIEKANYLDRALKEIGVSFTKVTVKKWFTDEARPKVQADSREKMFQICFALNATAENTEWFFHHVYFDRCFNCRQLKEAVYLFCMKNGRTYEQALSLYEKVENLADVQSHDEDICYTTFINNEISSLSSEDEFIEFVRNDPQNFKVNNVKIREEINKYIAELSHPEADKATVISIKNTPKEHPKKLPKECGLILRWLYEVNSYEVFMDMIYNKDVASKDFLICAITESKSGLSNNNIPSIIRTNFPSKKTISDIIEKDGVDSSYDAMRKLLILLKFASHWCNCKVADKLEYSPDVLRKIFIDETNCLLLDCGYSKLFAGNPYDWLFMHSAYSDDPMSYMQGFVQLDVE